MDPRRMKHIGSVDYYSPNSTVDAILDPRPPPENVFRPGNHPRIHYADLVITRPWSKFFGWTSFIPLDNCYQTSSKTILSVLAHPPPIEAVSGEDGSFSGYRLVRNNQWRNLEQNVYEAVCALKCAFYLPSILPFLPHVLGYDSIHANQAQLRQSITESRDWFLVWIGALSYCLYASEIYPDHLFCQQPYPRWRAALEGAGLSSAWIDQMIHSPIADYSSVRRVGCIIQLLYPEPGQPEVHWFFNSGVPVWYAWGEAEERAAKSNRELASCRPPHQIEPFLGFPGQRGLPSMRSGDTAVVSVDVGVVQGQLPEGPREPEWVAFLREREDSRPLIQARETAKQRQARENRARNPPTSSAPVFEWSLQEGGGDIWIRVPVPAKWRFDTLALHGASQKIYDPFFNEWDCCYEFGKMTQEEEEEMDGYASEPEALDLNAGTHGPPSGPSSPSDHIRLSSPPPLTAISLSELDSPPDLFQPDEPSGQEVDETFRLFYGCILPTPGTSIPENGDPRRRDIFFRLLGQRYGCLEFERLAYFLSKPYPPAQYLVDCILDKTNDFRGVWDLRDDCVRPARLGRRFRMLRRLQVPAATPQQGLLPSGSDLCDTAENYYFLEDPAVPAPWKLALISASAALTVCRLPDDFTPFDIAIWLVQRGVPFSCFYSSQPIPRPLAQLTSCFSIPLRPFHHKFTKEDYQSYVHLRTLILGQPHMQAAMKRGGIIWRLAIGTLGISGVLKPPSQWYRTRRITLGDAGIVEDTLTMNELDLICGAYECISSDGKQRSLRSWWPLARYYEKEECGENYGRWCGRREAWYEERLNNIEKDDFTAKPLSYTEWKSSQHGPRLIRTFHAIVEKSAFDLIAQWVPPERSS